MEIQNYTPLHHMLSPTINDHPFLPFVNVTYFSNVTSILSNKTIAKKNVSMIWKIFENEIFLAIVLV
jgi:hypothetical protein